VVKLTELQAWEVRFFNNKPSKGYSICNFETQCTITDSHSCTILCCNF